MLIIRASVNWREIEDILIHNTTEVDSEGNTIYELMNPEKPDEKLMPYYHIIHKRSDGYRKLLIKALEILEHNEMEPKVLNLES